MNLPFWLKNDSRRVPLVAGGSAKTCGVIRSSQRMAGVSALVTEGDAPSCEVVRRDLQSYPIPGENTNAESPHLSRDCRVYVMAIVHLHPERRIWQYFSNGPFQLDCFFLRHSPPVSVG